MAIAITEQTGTPPNASPPGVELPLFGSPYDLRTSMGENVPEADVRAAIKSGELGFVHSFQTGSAVDGPGVRIVAWLAGCQFRCVYCHNPDTWKMSNGMPVTLQRATEVISQYRHDLRITKGGLTISGGEPLMQDRFVIKVFTAAHKMGVHTALDTNGFLGEKLSDADLDVVDLVLLDLKAMTPELHKRLTSQDNKPIHEFARRLAAMGKPIWVRFVFIPGWTDDLQEVQRIAEFSASLENVERVDVLPFHQMGRYKWAKLGMEYLLQGTEPPSRESVGQAIEQFREVGLKAY